LLSPPRVFVFAAAFGSIAPNGGSGDASGACRHDGVVINDNATNGAPNAEAMAMLPDGGGGVGGGRNRVGGGSTSTDRDNDGHDADGDRRRRRRRRRRPCPRRAATAVAMMMMAGERGGEATARRL